ncbi:MAG: hypothetical protein GY930_08085 [bacterium]|nr:hypothetical protein [bacterium]
MKQTRLRYNKKNENTKYAYDAFYDTDIKATLEDNPLLHEIKPLLNRSETCMVVDSNGQVIEIESSIPEELLSGLSPGMSALAKRFMMSEFGALEVVFPHKSFLPKAPVGQGAVWYLKGKEDTGYGMNAHETRCTFRTPLEFEFYRVASHDLDLADLGEKLMKTPVEPLGALLITSPPGSKTDENIQGVLTFMPNGVLKSMVSLQKNLMEGPNEGVVLREKSIAVTQL